LYKCLSIEIFIFQQSTLVIKSRILVSHHNYLIASHLILLLKAGNHLVYNSNVSQVDLARSQSVYSADFLLISRFNYKILTEGPSTLFKTGLLLIPTKRQLISFEVKDSHIIEVPFNNLDVLNTFHSVIFSGSSDSGS